MDPVTIVSTAAAVAQIVGIIGKSIKFLDELHAKWGRVELTIISLRSQMTSLKAALSEILAWIESDLTYVPQHHQLVIDLEESISCCRLLMGSMESFLTELKLKDDGTFGFVQKIQTALRTKRYNDFQVFISHQTSALSLLLNACNRKTLSEQRILLEKSANRDVFDQIRDNSSSLLVLYDNESIHSKTTQSTGTSSRISRIFPFDSILMSSLAYQRTVRSLLKRSQLQRSADDISVNQSKMRTSDQMSQTTRRQSRAAAKLESKTSKDIDLMLQKDRRAIKGHFKFVIVGEPDDAMEVFMMLLRTVDPTKFEYILQTRKQEIVSSILNCTTKLVDDFNGDWQPTKQSSIDIFHQQTAPRGEMTPELAWAIPRIWKSPCGHIPSNISYFPSLPRHFLENIERIVQPDYIPTMTDILRFPSSSILQEMKFCENKMEYKFLLVRHLQSRQSKWMHQMENASGVLFVVDCCSYDQVVEHPDDKNRVCTLLEKTENLFKSTVNSRWLRKGPIVIVFCNGTLLPQRLLTSRLSDFLPDVPIDLVETDFSAVSNYLVDRFRRLIPETGFLTGKREFYCYFIERDSESPLLLQFIMNAVKDFVLTAALRDAKII